MTGENAKVIRILLVEDAAAFAHLVREYIAEALPGRCEIEHVDILAKAISSLQSSRFDLILTDRSLPDSSAEDTLFAVHAHAGDTPIVVVSGHQTDDWHNSADINLAKAWLPKRNVSQATLKEVIVRYAIR